VLQLSVSGSVIKKKLLTNMSHALLQSVKLAPKWGFRYLSGNPIGFIGLGNMGSNMAANLMKKGHSLVVYDINSAATEAAGKLGAKIATSPAEVAAQVDKVITMLPANQHVKDCYTGSGGVIESAKAGTILIDSSTVDPAVSKQVAEAASAKGLTFLDAPVSGGVPAAVAGTLTFMVGGSAEKCKEIEPVLLGMGGRVVHCGDVGAGEAAKICNNMLLGISMIGVAEAMNLGVKLGLDAKLLASIFNTSTGRCWSNEVYNPMPGVVENSPASRNYEGGFGTALMTKDLGLSQLAAAQVSAATPLGSLSHQIYRLLCTNGYGNKDFSAVLQFLREANDYQSNTKGNQ